MFFSVVLSYLPYALVTSFTPGPNNILAFHTVGQKGWVQGRSTLAGIVAGFFSVMAVCALGCYQPERRAALTQVLPFAGASISGWPSICSGAPLQRMSVPGLPFGADFFSSLSTGKLFCTPSLSIPATSCPPAAAPCSPYSPLSSPSSALRVFSPGQRPAGCCNPFCAGTPGRSTGPWPLCWPSAPWIFFFEPVAPHQIPHGSPADRATTAWAGHCPPETSPYSRLPVPGKARAVCLTEPGSATESGHRAHWRKSHRPAPGQPR